MKGLVFDSLDECDAALEQICLAGKQVALNAGQEVIVKDGEEMIVPLRNGVPDPDAMGTFRWDVPKKADGVEKWWCASPGSRYPEMLAAMGLEESEIPPEWLPQGDA